MNKNELIKLLKKISGNPKVTLSFASYDRTIIDSENYIVVTSHSRNTIDLIHADSDETLEELSNYIESNEENPRKHIH